MIISLPTNAFKFLGCIHMYWRVCTFLLVVQTTDRQGRKPYTSNTTVIAIQTFTVIMFPINSCLLWEKKKKKNFNCCHLLGIAVRTPPRFFKESQDFRKLFLYGIFPNTMFGILHERFTRPPVSKFQSIRVVKYPVCA